MKLTMATDGVELCGLSGYFLVYDAQAAADVTAAINSGLINTMADKIDPSIIEAANQAVNSVSSMS